MHSISTLCFQCVRYSEMMRAMTMLWKNNVPMCIEVLLLPECEHGKQRAESHDVSLPAPSATQAIMLEQWYIQGIPRRCAEMRYTDYYTHTDTQTLTQMHKHIVTDSYTHTQPYT